MSFNSKETCPRLLRTIERNIEKGLLKSKINELIVTIFATDQNDLFDIMFAEDTIFDIVGCLEFEPGAPAPKQHR